MDLDVVVANRVLGGVVVNGGFVFFDAGGVGVFVSFLQFLRGDVVIGIEHGDGFSTGLFVEEGVVGDCGAHIGGLGIDEWVVLGGAGLLAQVWVFGAGQGGGHRINIGPLLFHGERAVGVEIFFQSFGQCGFLLGCFGCLRCVELVCLPIGFGGLISGRARGQAQAGGQREGGGTEQGGSREGHSL